MRERPDFKFYMITPSIDPAAGERESVECVDSNGNRVVGHYSYDIVPKIHTISLVQENERVPVDTKLGEYAKWVSDFGAFERDPDEGPLNGLFGISTPLKVIEYLIENGYLEQSEYVAIRDPNGEVISGVLWPNAECEAVASPGKKNPHRKVLVPASPPQRDMFLLLQSKDEPVVVSKKLREELRRRFGAAVGFSGIGQASG